MLWLICSTCKQKLIVPLGGRVLVIHVSEDCEDVFEILLALKKFGASGNRIERPVSP